MQPPSVLWLFQTFLYWLKYFFSGVQGQTARFPICYNKSCCLSVVSTILLTRSSTRNWQYSFCTRYAIKIFLWVPVYFLSCPTFCLKVPTYHELQNLFPYVTQNSTYTRQNMIYSIILELIPMYQCIHWYRKYTCMYRGHFDRTAFIKAGVALAVEHQATTLKDVGSSPNLGKNFSFCVLSLSMRSWQVDWSHTNEIK